MMDRIVFGIAIVALISFTLIFSAPYYRLKEKSLEEVSLSDEPYVMEASTDKGIYHSGETLQMNVSVPAEGNLTLKVYGVKDRGGGYRINQEKELNGSEGILSMRFSLPRCYGCAGVSEGNYTIFCELVSNNSVVYNTTRMIELKK